MAPWLQLLHRLIGDHLDAGDPIQPRSDAFLEGRAESPACATSRSATWWPRPRLGVSAEEHERFFRGMLADIDEPTAPLRPHRCPG